MKLSIPAALEKLIFIDKAIDKSLFVYHLDITVLWATTKLSAPQPNIPRPSKAIGKELMLTPKVNKLWPSVTKEQYSIIPILTPNKSIMYPPKIGRIMLGKE